VPGHPARSGIIRIIRPLHYTNLALPGPATGIGLTDHQCCELRDDADITSDLDSITIYT
jgi:hypothetical protein